MGGGLRVLSSISVYRGRVTTGAMKPSGLSSQLARNLMEGGAGFDCGRAGERRLVGIMLPARFEKPGIRNLLVLILALCLGAGASSMRAAHQGELTLREVLPLTASQRARLALLVYDDPEAQTLFARLQAELPARLAREPRPLATIDYEGLVNTDPRRIIAVEHLQDMDDLAAIFEIWQVTADPAMATKAREYITAWSSVYLPTGNDVNENKFMPLIVAYESLRETFAADARQPIDRWLLAIAEKQAAGARTDHNGHRSNRHTKRLRLIAAIALSQGREDWLAQSWAGVRQFVSDGLHADGTSFDLLYRDSLTYHTGALVPLLDIALLARRAGVELYDWKSPAGASLRGSVEYVVPFADGRQTRQEWVNSRVELDRRRAAAGIAEYQAGRLYDPTDAISMFEAAHFFDPGLLPLIRRLRGERAQHFPSWRTVLNAACR